jgi:two-component system, response regulator RegA
VRSTPPSMASMSEPAGEPISARPVVIVDDDVSCLVAVEQILRHWGHETRTFRAFADARAYLAQAQPAAVIVDVRLGNYNGLQLIHFSQPNSPDTQWLVVSGFDDPVLRQEATKLGAHFLTKPLDLQKLRELLPPTATV